MDAITILPFCTIEAHDSEPFTTDTSVWLFSTFVHVRRALFSSLKEYNGACLAVKYSFSARWMEGKKEAIAEKRLQRSGGKKKKELGNIKCWNSYRDFALCTKIHFFLFSFFFFPFFRSNETMFTGENGKENNVSRRRKGIPRTVFASWTWNNVHRRC